MIHTAVSAIPREKCGKRKARRIPAAMPPAVPVVPGDFYAPSFAQNAECALVTVREQVIRMGLGEDAALVVMIDRVLAQRGKS
jgi:hypothetical protein